MSPSYVDNKYSAKALHSIPASYVTAAQLRSNTEHPFHNYVTIQDIK